MLKEMLLRRITVNKDFRSLKKGLVIDLTKPLFAIVGDNGSGKSSVLDALRDKFGIKDTSYFKQDLGDNIDVDFTEGTPVKFYDFHADDRKFSGTFGSDMSGQIGAMRSSSGQASIGQFARSGIPELRNGLVILDEPCRGLSIKMQHKFLNLFIRLLAQDNQIIISTHSAIFMRFAEICGQLYSLEHLKEFEKFRDLETEWLKEV